MERHTKRNGEILARGHFGSSQHLVSLVQAGPGEEVTAAIVEKIEGEYFSITFCVY